MAIPDYARKNFQTLLRAAEAGHLADGNPFEMYIPPESGPEPSAPPVS